MNAADLVLAILTVATTEAILVGGMVWILLRMERNRQPGACSKCGYSRRGLPRGAACPECGYPGASLYRRQGNLP